jgi:GT2 family glycosyltransferase
VTVPAPVVGVIVPVHGDAGHLALRPTSTTRQTYRPTETIIVYDGSSDDSDRVASTRVANLEGILSSARREILAAVASQQA